MLVSVCELKKWTRNESACVLYLHKRLTRFKQRWLGEIYQIIVLAICFPALVGGDVCTGTATTQYWYSLCGVGQLSPLALVLALWR